MDGLCRNEEPSEQPQKKAESMAQGSKLEVKQCCVCVNGNVVLAC